MSNKAMEGIYKVGYSTKDPQLRAKELSTAAPYAFVVKYEILVENPELLEKYVHQKLNSFNEGKEWFRVSLEECINTIKSCCRSHVYIENKYFDADDNHESNQQTIDVEAQRPDFDNKLMSSNFVYNFENNITDDDVRLSGMSRRELIATLTKIGYPNNINVNHYLAAKSAYAGNCLERFLILKQIKMITEDKNPVGSSTIYNMLEASRGKDAREHGLYKGKLSPWTHLVSGPRLGEFIGEFSDYLKIYISGTKIYRN